MANTQQFDPLQHPNLAELFDSSRQSHPPNQIHDYSFYNSHPFKNLRSQSGPPYPASPSSIHGTPPSNHRQDDHPALQPRAPTISGGHLPPFGTPSSSFTLAVNSSSTVRASSDTESDERSKARRKRSHFRDDAFDYRVEANSVSPITPSRSSSDAEGDEEEDEDEVDASLLMRSMTATSRIIEGNDDEGGLDTSTLSIKEQLSAARHAIEVASSKTGGTGVGAGSFVYKLYLLVTSLACSFVYESPGN